MNLRYEFGGRFSKEKKKKYRVRFSEFPRKIETHELGYYGWIRTHDFIFSVDFGEIWTDLDDFAFKMA